MTKIEHVLEAATLWACCPKDGAYKNTDIENILTFEECEDQLRHAVYRLLDYSLVSLDGELEVKGALWNALKKEPIT